MDSKTKQKLDELILDLSRMVVENKFNEKEQKVVLSAIDDLDELIEE
ncbi:hypothetical protein J7384_17200 [Endozoicomonas sp. G2_1]|nr:hypothetical protein [Endozoicomonas sp. G2_1]MBO9492102.1 hypothetical protein [Endozoicomonas sp. G2_1]